MLYIFNAIIVLFSICIALVMGLGYMGIGTYLVLIVIEYAMILIMNAGFRGAIRRSLRRKGTFGEENKHYPAVHLETLARDLEQMDADAFEYFIRDVLRETGYDVKRTPKDRSMGADMIVYKDHTHMVVKICHQEKASVVGSEWVQQVVAAKAFYKAERSMVVTNGDFAEEALTIATPNGTLMIGSGQLEQMLCHLLDKETPMEDKEAVPDIIRE